MTEEHTVLASLTLRIATTAGEHGADIEAIFDEVGLDWEMLRKPDARIPIKQHIAMGMRIVEQLGEAEIGMIIGQTVNSEDMGMVGYILRNSATLGDYIDNVCRYFSLISSAIEVVKIEQPGEVGLTIMPPPYIQVSAAPSIGIVSTVTRITTSFLERPCSPIRIELLSPRAELPEQFFEMVDCVVIDEASRIAIVFDEADMDVKVTDADPVLKRHLSNYADQLLPESTTSYADRVRSEVDSELEQGPTIDTVAASLAVSARTLQRRLASEKTNFATVLEEARRDRAIALLGRPEMTVAEIAYAVGYADAATFSNRFKLWTGKSPSQYR